MDVSYFAVLALLPQSSKCTELTETKRDGRDGVILLFKAGESIPVATWSVKKVNHRSFTCELLIYLFFYHTSITKDFILQPFECLSFFKI